MISLIGIRLQYIKRHLCLLICTYLLLPIIILLVGLLNLSNKEDIDLVPYNDPEVISEDNLFFNGPYTELDDIIKETLFVVDDEEEMCDKIKNYIANTTSIIIEDNQCTNNENKYIENLRNTIKIKGKKERHKIFVDTKSDSDLFQSSDLDEDIIVDPFYVGNSGNNKYIRFLKVQSFLSGLLIEINDKKIKKNFKMNFGFNPYPTHYEFT